MKKKVWIVVACAATGVVLAVLAAAFGAPAHVSIPLFVGCMAGGLAVVSMGQRKQER